jgi:enoyl-CoA hydratase/carnithine racemase
MSGYTAISVVRDPDLAGLVTITLNRPEKLNALDVTLHEELQDACAALQRDYDARVVVLTGAGRAFSAGAELGSRRPSAPVNDVDRRDRVHIGGETADAIEGLDQVTIAAVNGLAIGGAVVFASCCDIRLAAASAWFSIPEVELDLPMTWQAIPRLMRELGPARTKELVMACERFDASQAAAWGFVNQVHPDAELMDATRAFAARLLSMDPLSLASTKRACNAVANLMVPREAMWSDAEMMLLAYRQQAWRKSKDTGG